MPVRIALLAVGLAGCSCGGEDAGGDPCADVDCSGHGTCLRDGAIASCTCEPDFVQDGLSCVEDPVLHCSVEGDRDGDGDEIPACGGGDCDDQDPAVSSGAPDDVGDGVDQSCDDVDGVDADGDDVPSEASGGEDCDDADPQAHPGAPDLVGDGVDQSCDAADGIDTDGDGHATIASGGDDCDDSDAATFPGATETPSDGIDQSCDGVDGMDADGDGFASEKTGGLDCVDTDASIHPGAPDDAIGGGWTIEIARDEGAVGYDPSLVLDGGDTAHVVYNEPNFFGGNLHLATNAGGVWTDEVIEAGDLHFASLALDAGGDAHVVYGSYWAWSQALRYAYQTGAVWSFEDVDIGGGPADTSMALDADGDVHVVFVQGAPQQVGYVARVGGVWGAPISIERDVPYAWASLALDAVGTAHVCYGAPSTALHYASNDSGVFVRDDAAVPGNEGGWCSIAVDADGVSHVAHVHRGDGADDDSVKYSSEGTPWSTQTIADDGRYDGTTLALDPDGNAWVAYRKIVDPASELWVATNASGAWVTERVDDDVHTGYQPSIRVGADGITRVAYYDDGEQDLRYAWNVFVDGIDQDCDGGDG
jgi:hypothetical protein